MVYLWRAVDAEGKALDVNVQSTRNRHVALKDALAPKKYTFAPELMITDDLRDGRVAGHRDRMQPFPRPADVTAAGTARQASRSRLLTRYGTPAA
jgi:hypothetical protein